MTRSTDRGLATFRNGADGISNTVPTGGTRAEANGDRTKNLFHFGHHCWLGLVACGRGLRGGALCVAVLIWQHLNQRRGYTSLTLKPRPRS